MHLGVFLVAGTAPGLKNIPYIFIKL